MWARDPWSAQDMSTYHNLCSPAPTQSSGTMELGIKENINRIMKDCLVSLFLSVVGRAPFDGVKERWTFWSLSEIKAVNFRRWCFDQRTHSAKLWKTLVTRSFPNTIRTPFERIYLQGLTTRLIEMNFFAWLFWELTPRLCLSRFYARCAVWCRWQWGAPGTQSGNQNIDDNDLCIMMMGNGKGPALEIEMNLKVKSSVRESSC